MAKFFERNSTKLTISEFYDNFKLQKYNFEASYQRKSDVWSEDKKSFLIDSILKNYPIPAIFMRPIIDDDGRTKYDIIDGKQRLQSLISFIENKIPLTTYFSEDSFLDDESKENAAKIAGKLFEEIKLQKDDTDYVKQFWTYALQVEYLYEQNEELISSVFDRLNRNGEPLNPQELRNAKYANTLIVDKIHELARNPFMSDKLERLKIERMEDEEFISELLLLVVENQILDSNPRTLDEKYELYKNNNDALNDGERIFNEIVKFINSLELDFDSIKRLSWTTHLYSLFSVAWYCITHKITFEEIKPKIQLFYSNYFSKSTQYDGLIKSYKDAASSRTRSAIQRKNRMRAILSYCGIDLTEEDSN